MQRRWLQSNDKTFSPVQSFKRILKYAAVGASAVVIAGMLVACSFEAPPIPGYCNPDADPNCPINYNDGRWIPEEIDLLADTASETSLTSGDRWDIDQPTYNGTAGNVFRTKHGFGCAEANRGWVELTNGNDTIGVSIEDSEFMPPPMDNGMVFLNGWSLKYKGSDHEVKGVGVSIFNVRREAMSSGHTLRWQTHFTLTDENGDDDYEGCYYYTIVMWNSDGEGDKIPAYVIQNNADHSQTFVTEYAAKAGIRFLDYEHSGPPFQAAVVPRGFGLMYDGEDRHVLQLGFDFASSMTPGFYDPIRGRIAAILKDNSTRRFLATASVSVVGGVGVRWQLDGGSSSLQPRAKRSCPTLTSPSSRTEWKQATVQGDFAVPVLSKWDVGDICADHHLRKAGVSIDDWYYEKEPNAQYGVLHYQVTSTFYDDLGPFGSHGSQANYNVDILAFNRY